MARLNIYQRGKITEIPMGTLGKMKLHLDMMPEIPMLTWNLADGSRLQVQRIEGFDIVRYDKVEKEKWMVAITYQDKLAYYTKQTLYFDFEALRTGKVLQIFPTIQSTLEQCLQKVSCQSLYKFGEKTLSLISMAIVYPELTPRSRLQVVMDRFKKYNQSAYCIYNSTYTSFVPLVREVFNIALPYLMYTKLSDGGDFIVKTNGGYVLVDSLGNTSSYNSNSSPPDHDFAISDGTIHGITNNQVITPGLGGMPSLITATVKLPSMDTDGECSYITSDLTSTYFYDGPTLWVQQTGNLYGNQQRTNPCYYSSPDMFYCYYTLDDKKFFSWFDTYTNNVAYQSPYDEQLIEGNYIYQMPLIVTWPRLGFRLEVLTISTYVGIVTQRFILNGQDIQDNFNGIIDFSNFQITNMALIPT